MYGAFGELPDADYMACKVKGWKVKAQRKRV